MELKLKKLLVGLMLVTGVNIAQAQNLKYFETTPDGTVISLAPSTSSYNNGLIKTVWTKYTDPEKTWAMLLNQIHCPTRMMRVIQGSEYYAHNRIRTNFPLNLNAQWNYIIPGSTGSDIADYVCPTRN
jgi:hypothetical protein